MPVGIQYSTKKGLKWMEFKISDEAKAHRLFKKKYPKKKIREIHKW